MIRLGPVVTAQSSIKSRPRNRTVSANPCMVPMATSHHDCAHPCRLTDVANMSLYPIRNGERAPLHQRRQVKWFRDNHTVHCQTHETSWFDKNETIAHDANSTAMNTTCKCTPKHSFHCIQVSGNVNGKRPATTQTHMCHNI